MYKMILSSFSSDSELTLQWYLTGTAITSTNPVYKLMRDGLKAVLKIQKAIEDFYGKLSVIIEGSEIKDVKYIPVHEKGSFI